MMLTLKSFVIAILILLSFQINSRRINKLQAKRKGEVQIKYTEVPKKVYDLKGVLGKGGFGKVLMVYDETKKKYRVIKEIQLCKETIVLIVNELRVFKRLKKPLGDYPINLMMLDKVKKSKTKIFLYLPPMKTDLMNFVKSSNNLTHSNIIYLLRHAAIGILSLHQNEIIHNE